MKRVSISLPSELSNKARELNINVSEGARNGIQMSMVIKRLQTKRSSLMLELNNVEERLQSMQDALAYLLTEQEVKQ